MKEKMRRVWWIAALALIVPVIATSQAKIQQLAVSGQTGSVPITQIDGKNYVQVEALAQLVGGAVSFKGNQITLTLQAAAAKEPPTKEPPPTNAAKVGFSTEFLRAGIEEMSTIREWHSALTTAIENQVPVVPELLGPYETAATRNLRVAQAAAATDADQHAAQMITNEFQKMKQLSDYYLAQRASATYINAAALSNDPLNQSLIACGQALGAVVSSGQFTNESACR